MKRIAKTAGVLGLAGCVAMSSPFAAADDAFWYGGLNAGQSRAKIDDPRISAQLLNSGLATSSIVNDERDPAYKLFGGYQYNRMFALEAGYFDLGQFGYTATTVPTGTQVGKIKLKGVNLDLVGFLPLTEQFSAFGRVGVNYAQAKDNFTATGAVAAPTNANPSKSAANYKAGMGLQYDFTDAVGMRLEAERYRINDAVGRNGDVNMYSLGLVYRFREKKSAPVAAMAPVAVAEPARVVIVPVKVKTQEYCSILDIQFEIKNDDIQREDKEKLAVLGAFMKKYPDTTAVIEGFTDDVGALDYNQKLSQRRAQSVVSYLMDEHHISSTRLTAIGYGETRPIADNSTRAGHQANRRISAVIACVTDIANLKVSPARMTMAMEIGFDPYMAEIQPQYRDGLAEVAKFMRANPSVDAIVEGHDAKSVGTGPNRDWITAAESMKISQQRAQAVVNYLADKEGISRARFSTASYGANRRVSYGTSLEGQQENRRANIIFDYHGK